MFSLLHNKKPLSTKVPRRVGTSRGFTIVEMLVSILVFFSVVVLAMTSLLSVMDASRKARAFNSVMGNISVVYDRMAREVRLGSNYYCGSSASGTQDCPVGGTPGSTFSFTNKDGVRVSYVGPTPPADTTFTRTVFGGSSEILNSPDVEVETFDVYVSGSASGGADSEQPTVVFVLTGKALSDKVGIEAPFRIQTTVTQRVFDR